MHLTLISKIVLLNIEEIILIFSRIPNTEKGYLMGKWTDADTAKHSGDSSSKVAAAEHQARDDGEEAGVFKRGDSDTNSERFSRTDESGEKASGFWKSIFG